MCGKSGMSCAMYICTNLQIDLKLSSNLKDLENLANHLFNNIYININRKRRRIIVAADKVYSDLYMLFMVLQKGCKERKSMFCDSTEKQCTPTGCHIIDNR